MTMTNLGLKTANQIYPIKTLGPEALDQTTHLLSIVGLIIKDKMRSWSGDDPSVVY